MNKREAAILTAYTGICIGPMKEFHKYVEEKFNRPVWTHHMLTEEFWKQLKELSKNDFIDLCNEITYDDFDLEEPEKWLENAPNPDDELKQLKEEVDDLKWRMNQVCNILSEKDKEAACDHENNGQVYSMCKCAKCGELY